MTNWILHLYLNTKKTDLFKSLSFERLIDIAYCLDTKIYEVSNFYHGIKKPHGIFKFITTNSGGFFFTFAFFGIYIINVEFILRS